jgi:hypothetical protein
MKSFKLLKIPSLVLCVNNKYLEDQKILNYTIRFVTYEQKQMRTARNIRNSFYLQKIIFTFAQFLHWLDFNIVMLHNQITKFMRNSRR